MFKDNVDKKNHQTFNLNLKIQFLLTIEVLKILTNKPQIIDLYISHIIFAAIKQCNL